MPRDVPRYHDDLVATLCADLRPVRPSWPVRTRLVLWLALMVTTVGLGALLGLRDDFGARSEDARYVLEVAFLVGAAAAAAGVVLASVVPGRPRTPRLARLSVVCALVAVALGRAAPDGAATTLARFVANGLQCAACVGAFGLLPALALLAAAARSGAPDGRTVAFHAGVTACLAGAAAVRLACPIDDPLHTSAWHVLPIAAWAALSAALAGSRIERWLPPERSTSAGGQ